MSSLGSELHEPAAPLSDIVAMDAAALTAAIHARDVSCVEVMTAYLDHIEGLNPKVPMGIQIVAPVHREFACLQLAYAYEQVTRWTSKRLPPLLAPMHA